MWIYPCHVWILGVNWIAVKICWATNNRIMYVVVGNFPVENCLVTCSSTLGHCSIVSSCYFSVIYFSVIDGNVAKIYSNQSVLHQELERDANKTSRCRLFSLFINVMKLSLCGFLQLLILNFIIQ